MSRYGVTRKACEHGHFECLSIAQRGTACNLDAARCVPGRLWKGSHLWDTDTHGCRYCIRCARGHAADCEYAR
jgi:hypothetical protein